MKNKYVLTRKMNIRFLNEHLVHYLYRNMRLARYDVTEEEVENNYAKSIGESESDIALRNFYRAWLMLIEDENVEINNDYLLKLHEVLMDGLNGGVKSSLTDEQIVELTDMLKQYGKSNTEVAIDVMLYILDKRLFSDGDVRVALMFANKIMLDNGCGIITIADYNDATFREKLKNFHQDNKPDFKNWIYRCCIEGVKGNQLDR